MREATRARCNIFDQTSQLTLAPVRKHFKFWRIRTRIRRWLVTQERSQGDAGSSVSNGPGLMGRCLGGCSSGKLILTGQRAAINFSSISNPKTSDRSELISRSTERRSLQNQLYQPVMSRQFSASQRRAFGIRNQMEHGPMSRMSKF